MKEKETEREVPHDYKTAIGAALGALTPTVAAFIYYITKVTNG